MVNMEEYSMSNASFVKIGESKKTTTCNRSQFLLIQSISFSQIGGNGSAVTVLHNDLVFTKWVDPHPELIVVTANIKVPDDILGGAFFQCFGCLLDLLGVRDDSGFLDSNKFIGRCIQC